MNMPLTFSTHLDVHFAIADLEDQITAAKRYLKKLKEYRRYLLKIQSELAAIAEIKASTPHLPDLEVMEFGHSQYDDSNEEPVGFPEPVDAPSVESVDTSEGSVDVPVEPVEPVDATESIDVPESVEPVDAPESVESVDASPYHSMGIRALRLLARDRGIKGAARMTKAQCIAALLEN